MTRVRIRPARAPRFGASLVFVVSFLAGTVVSAQQGGGYGPGGGYTPAGGGSMSGGGAWDGGGGRGMGRPPFDPSDIPTPEEIDGPPNPPTTRQLLSLADSQTQRYTTAWDSLMRETGVKRDSARTAREAMRSSFRDHDRQGVETQAKLLTALGKDLRKQDDAFDKSLTFLSKDQRKQYEDYKKQQKQAREEERKRRFRERSGGDSAPQSP
jgi:hypothetical protein